MLPRDTPSTVPSVALFVGARSAFPRNATQDFESINTRVTSFTTELVDWEGNLINNEIVLSSPGMSDIVTVQEAGITEFSFSFDQSDRPIVGYVAQGNAKLWWFDVSLDQIDVLNFGSTVLTPQVSLDDKHRLGAANSDVIYAYIRDGMIRFRVQRERFLVEHDFAPAAANERLRRIGLNQANAFQFEIVQVFDPI